MIRFIEFPEKQTAEIRDRLNAAGDGAKLRVIPSGTPDGCGVKFSIGVIGGSVALADGEDCDTPTNDSRVCPPICP